MNSSHPDSDRHTFACNYLRDAVGGHLQEFVADGMVEAVVDDLEFVDVEKGDTDNVV